MAEATNPLRKLRHDLSNPLAALLADMRRTVL